jgi:hypothetical protein
MKKLIISALVLMALGSIAFALYGTGYGKSLTAATTFARADGFTANTISIYNSGSPDLFVLVNCTLPEFTNRMTAGTAIKIPSTMSWTFNAGGQDSMSSLCYGTTNSTTAFFFGAY